MHNKHIVDEMSVLFEKFAKSIVDEEHLLPQDPIELVEQYKKGLSVVKVFKNQIVAHITLWHLHEDWYEYGTFWVHPDYRIKGYAKLILNELLEMHKDKNILSTTTNALVMNLNVKNGIKQALFDDLESELRIATCICGKTKTSVDNPLKCKIANKKCKLFVFFKINK